MEDGSLGLHTMPALQNHLYSPHLNLDVDIVCGVSHQPNYGLACNENSPYRNQVFES